MASIGLWKKAANIEGVGLLSTTGVYSKIKGMGLKTVQWIKFSPSSKKDILNMKKRCSEFITKHTPCLFIWEPRHTGEKGYIIDVNEISQVVESLASLPVLAYSYLITTQISNPKKGFIGSVISDGKGKLYCETYHEPGICSHRVLSQSKIDENKSSFFGRFSTVNFDLFNLEGSVLSSANVRTILNNYSGMKGYFEFVYGVHLGNWELCTTGFENLGFITFPEHVVSAALSSTGNRWRAETLRHYSDF
ncbi:hypothetical protein HN592_01615 [Candidatus Woesearchaeota archaeon]|jgi:hypothetical protein|nr:hypothetical protein [Candidatus Woesearchaeota archaeon]MBT4368617.1 hypothetical protein [Candidatus Woesearchaeota archaeon]MBT4713074.1 hypothetical protein [Candidatus Woesearchaeota archaeon]MBT6638996.1 hypothetical protein [Candidatus Woesearchaeota archaeon]MBT7134195.1 hypothetical protein [Candidatus Woesearchaeota archaeon]